jgi:hypothetical protein
MPTKDEKGLISCWSVLSVGAARANDACAKLGVDLVNVPAEMIVSDAEGKQ